MKQKYFAVIILKIIFISSCVNNEQELGAKQLTQKEIELAVADFAKIFNEGHVPTISEYQRFFGYSDAEEFQWYWKECEENKQTPYLRNNDCYQNALKSWASKDMSVSRFLVWLKTVLPNNPKHKISEIIPEDANKSLAGYRVVSYFDAKKLEFWFAKAKSNATPGAELVLTSIDGVPLSVLANTENQFSILAALGEKDLLRPLTQEEKDLEKELAEARCKQDPSCGELKKAEKLREEAREQRVSFYQNFDESFKNWCRDNKEACRKYRQSKYRLNEANNEIKRKCESSPEQCETAVSQWFTETKKTMFEYCASNKEICNGLDKADKGMLEQQDKWCADNLDHCTRVLSNYERVLAQLKLAYYSSKAKKM